MNRLLDGFTTSLNFKLSDHAPPYKIALAEGGTVLFETRSACSGVRLSHMTLFQRLPRYIWLIQEFADLQKETLLHSMVRLTDY